jgi:hypothetical protein
MHAATSNLEVYLNSGGALYENFHTGTGWSGATGIGGSVTGSVG